MQSASSAAASNAPASRPDVPPTASPVPATPGLLRSINNRTVLELLIQHPSLSRGDVCSLTGVSKPTASQLLTRLLDAELVLDAGPGSPRPGGRPPQMYKLNPRAGFAAAINVDPTSIQVRVADLVSFCLGDEFEWDVELSIEARAVRPVVLGSFGHLGWTSWISPKTSQADTTRRCDARFNAARRIERERLAQSAAPE